MRRKGYFLVPPFRALRMMAAHSMKAKRAAPLTLHICRVRGLCPFNRYFVQPRDVAERAVKGGKLTSVLADK